MIRTEVKSSSIASIAYDAATQTLEVQFVGKPGSDGPVWQYAPVPPEVYGAMLLPGNSVGQLFHREVKANPTIAASRVEVPA